MQGANYLPNATGKLTAFAIDPFNRLIMYAGGGAGPANAGPYSLSGLFKTTDGGKHWVRMNHGLYDPFIDCVWVDPSNPTTLLVGTWFDGIFRSTDGGNSWSNVFSVRSVTSFLLNGSTLYASSWDGVLASHDLGSSWSYALTTNVQVNTLATSGGKVYAGLVNGTILLHSGPAPWHAVSYPPGQGNPSQNWYLSVNASNPQNVYAAEIGQGLFSTLNGGVSWARINLPDGTPQVFEVDPFNTAFALAGFNGAVMVSRNGGASYSATSLQVDAKMIQMLNASSAVVGSDQGLFVTPDYGQRWLPLGGNISSSLLYSVSVSNNAIISAAQDFNPLVSFDGGATWLDAYQGHSFPTGENGVALFNPGNSSVAYIFSGSGFQFSTDGGVDYQTSTQITPGLPAGSMQNIIAVSSSSPKHVYVATSDGVFGSRDWGHDFVREPWPFHTVNAVAVNPVNAQNILVANNTGMYYSTDGGSSWGQSNFSGENITLPNFVATVAFGPTNPAVIIVGLAHDFQLGGGVYKSTDGGKTFLASNSGLTNIPTGALSSAGDYSGSMFGHWAWQVSFSPDSSLVLLATAMGIYASNDGGNTWVFVDGNVPTHFFTGVSWSGTDAYASTFGDGIIKTQVSALDAFLSPQTSTSSASSISSTSSSSRTSAATSVSSSWQSPTTMTSSSTTATTQETTTPVTTSTMSSSIPSTDQGASDYTPYLIIGTSIIIAGAIISISLSRRGKRQT